MVEVKKTMNTWGGDTLILASDNKLYIGRYARSAELTSGIFIKEITDHAKGKTVAQMMDWHFDTFHQLPLVQDAPESVKREAGSW